MELLTPRPNRSFLFGVRCSSQQLFDSVGKGDVKTVQSLLAQKADPSWRNAHYSDRTALHRVCLHTFFLVCGAVHCVMAFQALQDGNSAIVKLLMNYALTAAPQSTASSSTSTSAGSLEFLVDAVVAHCDHSIVNRTVGNISASDHFLLSNSSSSSAKKDVVPNGDKKEVAPDSEHKGMSSKTPQQIIAQ